MKSISPEEFPAMRAAVAPRLDSDGVERWPPIKWRKHPLDFITPLNREFFSRLEKRRKKFIKNPFTAPCRWSARVLSHGRMAIADRDYYRNQGQGGGFMSQVPPVVKWLLILNLGIFVLDYLILPLVLGLKIDGIRNIPPIFNWGAFTVQTGIYEYRFWEFVTFQFIHGSVGHVLFNCIGLYFFGPWMERWWGSKRFLAFYLLCGAAGAAFFTLLMSFDVVPGDIGTPLVGASAGIYGVLIGVAFIAPNLRVTLLFPPVELSMRQLAIWLMLLSVGMIFFKIGGNEGGEAGHLGGAILGFILMRYPKLLGGGAAQFSIGVNTGRVRGAPPAKLRPRTELQLHEDPEVDAILDKISRDGFQSLTQAERDTLREAAERHQSNS